MLLLHSFLYFFFSGGLLAGISDCIAITLGNNNSVATALALGACLIPIALGMRFYGAGYAPGRASFILLGFTGALPSIAHMPFIAIGLSIIIILPLRAWGANLNMSAHVSKIETVYLILAGLLGFTAIPYFVHGTIGFTLVWAATLLLQKKALVIDKHQEQNKEPQPFQLKTFFAGSAITALALSLAPIVTTLDYGTVQNQFSRHITLLLMLTIVWVTIASPLASLKIKKIQFVSGLALAASAPFLREHVLNLCQTDVFAKWLSDPRILGLFNLDTRFLPEESIWFVPYITVLGLSLPIMISGIFTRTHIDSEKHLFSWVLGVGSTLIAAAILPYPANINYFTPLAILCSLYASMPKNILRASIIAIVFISLFNQKILTNPKVNFPLKNTYNWEIATGQKDKFYMTAIRRQLLMNNKLYEFDGRNIVSPLPSDSRSWAGVKALIDKLSTKEDIALNASHQWLPRRNLLRSELIREAAYTLNQENKLFLTIPVDECQPKILPQLVQEFRENFTHTSLFLYSESAHIPFLIIIASNSSFNFENLAPFKITLNSNLQGNSLLLKGPWRLSEKIMGLSTPKLIEGMQRFQRCIAVLEEIKNYQSNSTPDILDFFLFHLRAQEYSVHDTYLSENPLDTECSIEGIKVLAELSKKHPQSKSLKILWENLFILLVEAREVNWLESSVNILKKIGWSDSFITIGEIHVCLEKLEFSKAEKLSRDILESEPQHRAAQELLRLAQRKEQVPRDSHAGHNH